MGVDPGRARLYDEFVFSAAERNLVTIAKGRFGVASRVEARDCGLSDEQVLNRIRAGVLEEAALGALVVGAAPKSWEQDVALAVLSMGDQAAASHMTAAALFGMLNTSGGRVEVVVQRWDRKHRAFTVHESRDLIEEDVMIHRGVRVTVPARVVVDIGAVYPAAVSEVFHRGRRLGLMEAQDVEAVVRRVARKGRDGVGPAKALLKSLAASPDRTESWAEDMYLRITRGAGLREPIQQLEVRTDDGWFICRCDFGYSPERLAIFVDGFAYHGDQSSFQKDRLQGNQLAQIGWRYLRFTYWDLVNRPQYVIQQVSSLLA